MTPHRPGAPPKTILFDGVPAFELTDAVDHQGTWIARYAWADRRDALPRRLRSFVDFNLEWARRCDDGEDPDPAGFDAYCDLMGRWTVRFEGGAEHRILDAPSFDAHEVSFSLACRPFPAAR